MPYLQELTLNNLHGVNLNRIYQQILTEILNRSESLTKLKISNTNLDYDSLVNLICEIIKKLPLLVSLDLSWCKLNPSHLLNIAKELKAKPNRLRSLNISYNNLCFDARYTEKMNTSEDFIDEICAFLQASTSLNHLNMSGLMMKEQQLNELCDSLVKTPNLIAIHLSDIGLCNNKPLLQQVLDFFGINEDFDKECKHHYRHNKNPDLLQKLAKTHSHAAVIAKDPESKDLPQYQDYVKKLVKTSQTNMVKKNLMINKTQQAAGALRTQQSMEDIIILTRKKNHPELIFNQDLRKDGYWHIDSELSWKISYTKNVVNTCYVCQNHKYTMIYYNSRTNNPGLVEITDKQIVQTVRDNLNIEKNDDSKTPIICGTTNNGGFHNNSKMLRADIFSLLSVC